MAMSLRLRDLTLVGACAAASSAGCSAPESSVKPPLTDSASTGDSGDTPGTHPNGDVTDGGGDDRGGTDGSTVPHVVRWCSGAGAPVGVWDDVTPPQIPIKKNSSSGTFDGSGGIIAVAVDPQDPATVYAAGGSAVCCTSGSSGIFKSTDCGATWAKVSTGANSDLLEKGWQWGTGIVIDSVTPTTMYAQSGYGSEGLFKSVNGGVDWTQLFLPDSQIAMTVSSTFTQNAAMDPSDHTHLVVTFHSNCSGAYAPMCLAD